MVVGAVASRTELAIIGSGPGGYAAALQAADAGLEVTLIDSGPIGGVCLNVGCIPSKALIHTANRRWHAIEAAAWGLTSSISVDMATLSDKLVATTNTLRHGVTSLLRDAGVNVVAGHAHFARHDRLSIAHGDLVSHLEFDNAILATGSRPIELPGLPWGPTTVDSSKALRLRELPSSILLVGGGYIGVELGTAFAKLGSDVTIVEAGDQLLSGLPSELARPVAKRLDELGVVVSLGRHVISIDENRATLSDGSSVACEIAIVAAGRHPNTDTCSAEQAGIKLTPTGHVVVGPDLSATDCIYAIGDVTPGLALAHRATAQAEVAVKALLGNNVTFDPAAVPAVVFSDPEILSVGVTPQQATAHGWPVAQFPHIASGRAIAVGEPSGVTMIVSDPHGTVRGVHAVGPHVSELAGEAALAIEMAATVGDLAATIHAHPTIGETLVEAALVGLGRPLHVRQATR